MSFPSAIIRAYGWLVGRDFGDHRDGVDSDDAWFIGWGVQSATGVRIDQATAMACAAVMCCVSILAEDIAKLTPKLWRRKRGGGRKEATDHYLAPFLKRPNSWQTWMEFCCMLMVGLLLRGNGYAVIVRDRAGRPLYFVPVNPDQVALWEAPDGSLFYMVTRAGLHQLALLSSEPLMIPARNIFHLRGLSANGLLGLSKISMNREAIGLALAQEQQAARWIGNGAKPAGILTTDQKLTDEVAQRAKQRWVDANATLANVGKTAVLEMGLKWQPLSLTSQDVEFIASRQFQLQEIARMWRIPPHMIGELSRSTNNNVAQQSQDYFNSTLSTYTQIWKTRLEFTFDLDEDGVFLEFDRSILLEGDIAARYAVYRLGLQGVISTNEARAMEGLDPAKEGDNVAAGDQVYRPINMVPLGTDVALGADLPGLGSESGGDNPGAGAPNVAAPDPDQVARLAQLEASVEKLTSEMQRFVRRARN